MFSAEKSMRSEYQGEKMIIAGKEHPVQVVSGKKRISITVEEYLALREDAFEKVGSDEDFEIMVPLKHGETIFSRSELEIYLQNKEVARRRIKERDESENKK